MILLTAWPKKWISKRIKATAQVITPGATLQVGSLVITNHSDVVVYVK